MLERISRDGASDSPLLQTAGLDVLEDGELALDFWGKEQRAFGFGRGGREGRERQESDDSESSEFHGEGFGRADCD